MDFFTWFFCVIVLIILRYILQFICIFRVQFLTLHDITNIQLEKRFNEVEQFYSKTNKKQSNTSKGSSATKDNEKDKPLTSFKKRQQDASRREAAAAKRMQDLMRQLAGYLRLHIIYPLHLAKHFLNL